MLVRLHTPVELSIPLRFKLSRMYRKDKFSGIVRLCDSSYPESGVQFDPEWGAQFTPDWSANFYRNFH
jgi:hypothetical protein